MRGPGRTRALGEKTENEFAGQVAARLDQTGSDQGPENALRSWCKNPEPLGGVTA